MILAGFSAFGACFVPPRLRGRAWLVRRVDHPREGVLKAPFGFRFGAGLSGLVGHLSFPDEAKIVDERDCGANESWTSTRADQIGASWSSGIADRR